jgi:hypothetical protein
MELTSAEYHRAAAARARRLRAEATTPWWKARLDEAIARHEKIAEEIGLQSEQGRPTYPGSPGYGYQSRPLYSPDPCSGYGSPGYGYPSDHASYEHNVPTTDEAMR